MANICEICGGTGKTKPARDLLARPPKEQAEYDREHAELPDVACWLCGGSGFNNTDTKGQTHD